MASGERIFGHGIDLVDTARIARMLDDHGDRFLDRCFCPSEIDLAGDGKRRLEHLAGRFAAKEAILKALGVGWRDGIAWTDMEIVRQPSGAPALRLSGRTAELVAAEGISRWLISISHVETHAIGSAIAIIG